ncbi:DUF3263 domain-containing protein [Janibacter terrae]|uniref:DUF3263 domain-containing protein n=1 Tax=Janibacter terrae TaxID=103817 RepID=UPI0031F7A4B2
MLTDTDRALLAVWKRWPLDGQRGERMMAFIDLGLSEITANQAVNRLLDRRDAWEADPVTVGRLARLRDARKKHRGCSPGNRFST